MDTVLNKYIKYVTEKKDKEDQKLKDKKNEKKKNGTQSKETDMKT